MNQASALVSLEPMDLSLVMIGLLTEFEDQPVEAAGPLSAEVMGNPGLVEIAVRNGIRNALESQAAAGVGESVVVTWNRTDREAWVTVLDRGSGFPKRTSQVFQFGSSTKEGHVGAGLALARRCANSLHGNISVRNRDGGGAAFELRWRTVFPGDASTIKEVENGV
jgi:signal transduction histidine kinase